MTDGISVAVFGTTRQYHQQYIHIRKTLNISNIINKIEDGQWNRL
jgi:hypothetical protein